MRVLIISAHQSFRQQVQAACLRFDKTTVSIRTAESMGQGMELALQFEAQLVFLDLTRNHEAGVLSLEQLAHVKNRLVAVSADKMGTDLMARAIRTGAGEILPQPVVDDEVFAIIEKAMHLQSEDAVMQPPRSGKSIMCFSSKGGVGKTSLSCNIAVALSGIFGDKKVALLDANIQAPNIAPMLDLRPVSWLKDAVAEYKRLDSQLLEDFMTVHAASGVHVLAHNTNDPLGVDYTEDQLTKILLVSKGTYDWTIVDTFPLLSSLNLSLMDLCDEIILVTEAVVPSLRSAKHNLDILQQAGYGENRIRVVINRFSNFEGNISPELCAEALGWPIEQIIPYDVHATIATNSGKPYSQMYPDRKITASVKELVEKIVGTHLPKDQEETALDKYWRQFKNWMDI
ncbi:P-loop NTPase [Methylophilus aquaticus]|uniref:P-loop NTPase n=1 Tax=Methylophilus aquaticus TaxID=1971610 RepID=A0ABT9JP86_9PROT|nr:P-loop NTPase [Methylophilus aquaticus]MDP8566387.1 P-loop NTPase [Methylophilus aquaticus]